jgi:hypothetical protein
MTAQEWMDEHTGAGGWSRPVTGAMLEDAPDGAYVEGWRTLYRKHDGEWHRVMILPLGGGLLACSLGEVPMPVPLSVRQMTPAEMSAQFVGMFDSTVRLDAGSLVWVVERMLAMLGVHRQMGDLASRVAYELDAARAAVDELGGCDHG